MNQLMTDRIIEQILAIRASGKYNMFDRKGVQYEAYQQDYFELVVFLEEHPKEYSRFIMTGERA